jgi:hypothetical protein
MLNFIKISNKIYDIVQKRELFFQLFHQLLDEAAKAVCCEIDLQWQVGGYSHCIPTFEKFSI